MLRRLASRLSGFALLAFVVSLLSCGREITGPGGGGVGAISFAPQFPEIRLAGNGEVLGIGAVVPFTQVRVVLRRADGSVAIDRVVEFPPGQETLSLSLQVPLSPGAPSTGETLSALMRFINAAGDTVFAAGPLDVVARPASSTAPPPPVPILPIFVGPGANAASITIAPDTVIGTINQQSTFTAIVRDSANAPLPAAPIAFTSTDSARVRVGLATGVATLLGARGSALIIAQTLTGQYDTAFVQITPTASAIALVSGGAQQTLQGTPFPAPVRVRVNAADGIGVQGVTVNFAVTAGGGTVSVPSAVTDAAGEALVTWTAGNVAGAGTLTASVPATSISLAVNGQQLSSAPTSLAISASPANFTAGDTIPTFTVTVRDAVGGTVAGFSGLVSLGLSGGTAGANIVGVSARNAVNGVATFPGLTIDRAGSAYRIAASVTGVPSVLTNPFDVAAAPARFVTIVGGAGQTAPPSTPLPDSIRVRVTDVFGFPRAGLIAQFAVVAGGGSVAPTSVTTDADGRAATQWTLGAAGAQQITVTVGAIQPVPVNATVFTGGGTPTLFIGTSQIGAPIGASRTVPVFISPAAGAPIVAQLVTRDTLVAKWTTDSVVFPAGVGLRNPSLSGRGVGSTFALVTSSAGTDSVLVTVDSVGISIGTYSNEPAIVGDTLPHLVRLSAPAGAGGVVVTVRSSDSLALRVAPGSGKSPPGDPCDLYCYDLRTAPDEVQILATPADSALVVIPEGQLSGYVVLFPIAPAANGVTVTATSPNLAGASELIYPEVGTLQRYSYWGTLGTTMPVGHRERLDIYRTVRLARDLVVRATSRNPAVIRVDSQVVIPRQQYYSGESALHYEGLAAGSSWIVISAPGFATDSFQVSVVAPVLVVDAAVTTVVGADYEVGVLSTTDSLNFQTYLFPPRGSDLTITAISRDPSIAQVIHTAPLRTEEYYAYVTVRGVALGSTWVVMSAPGYASDSVFVTVAGASLDVSESFFRIGRGQVHLTSYAQLYGGGNFASTGRTATVTSSDTSVLSVLTPQLAFGTNGASDYIRLLGKALGSATITTTVAGLAPDVRVWTVTEPDLFLSTFGSGGNINADSATYTLFTSMRDGVSIQRPPADTVVAVLRSSNPAALLVTDSIVRYLPGSASSSMGRVRAIAPGTAQLVLSAPNFRSDTSGLITLLPRRLEFSQVTVQHGRALDLNVSLSRRSPNAGVLPFSITRQGPAGVVPLAASDSFPAGNTSRSIVLRAGLGVGTDTVIVSAAGHAPDTLFVVVGTSLANLSVDQSGLVGQQDDFVSVFMRPTSVFSYRASSANIAFAIRSSDTTVVRVLTDTIRVNAGASSATTGGYGSVRFVRPGSAWIRLIDPAGTFATDSVQVFVEYQQLYSSGGNPTIGVQQQSSPFEYYVYRDFASSDSLWVRLTNSAPGVLTAPDSVLIPPFSSYAYYSVASRDSVGSARITGSAPGYAEFQADFYVVRGRLEAYSTNRAGVGETVPVEAYLTEGTGYTRRASVAVPVRLRVDDPTLLTPGADSLGTIAVDDYSTSLNTLQGLAPGFTGFTVEDRRSASAISSVIASRTNIELRTPQLRFQSTRLQVGLRTANQFVWLSQPDGGPGATVLLTSTTGRSRGPGGPIVIDPGSGSGDYIPIEGVTAGLDTLVATAPGYLPDTMVVDVGPNLLRLIGNVPATIRQGDSVQVTLALADANGSTGYVEVAEGTFMTLNFSSAGGIQAVRLSGGNLTTTSLSEFQSNITFWLRATGPSGGSITVSGPEIMTFQLGVATRP